VTGEASPYYLFHPEVPARLAGLLPRAKLIAMVRNPADRAISHYHRECAKGRESLPLIEAIEREERRLAVEAEASGPDPFQGPEHHRHSYLARGRYAEQLGRWFSHFPREQIRVVHAEQLFRDPGPTYRSILRFLDLPTWEPASYPRWSAGIDAEVDPTVRARLIEYFKPHNRRLYDLLGQDLGWEGPRELTTAARPGALNAHRLDGPGGGGP
jgi:hypothetical protein